MAESPERLAPGVYRVDAVGIPNAVNVLLLENDDGWTLVDTGVAGSVRRIREALGTLGSGPEEIRRIFLTHQHSDHTGGLPGMLQIAPQAEVGAAGREAEVISGRRAPDVQEGRLLRLMSSRTALPTAPVGKVLHEGDFVSGFRIIATPGHTLGHVSLLRDDDGLLFTADAFGCMPRRLRVGVRRAFCTDYELARRSARKLLEEEFATVVFSHGGTLRAGARAALRAALERS
ncbi:MAG: MBL fold metallo-hydrolase [Rubrobacteraceae bacterium]|nr:MBL fold metallo-hydrolase [Rubrobacteraceae bacterium]